MARPRNEHRRALQERAGIGERAARKWIATGIDTDSFLKHRERKLEAAADISEKHAIMAQLKIEELKRRLMPRDEVVQAGKKIAALFSSEISRFNISATKKLTGLDEIGVRKVLDSECDILIKRLKERLVKI